MGQEVRNLEREQEHIQRLVQANPEILGPFRDRLDCGYREVMHYLVTRARTTEKRDQTPWIAIAIGLVAGGMLGILLTLGVLHAL